MYLRASDRGCVNGEFGARALGVEKNDVFMVFEIFSLFASDHPLPWLGGGSYEGDRSVQETASGKWAKEKETGLQSVGVAGTPMLLADKVRGPESPEPASSCEICHHMPVLLPLATHQNPEEHLRPLLRLRGNSDEQSGPQPQVMPGAGRQGPVCGRGRAEGTLAPGHPPSKAPLPPHPCSPGGSLAPVRYRGW